MPRTLEQAIALAARTLAPHSPSPRLDAEILARHALHLSRTQLVMRAHDPLSPHEEEALQKLIVRRRQGEPVAYITGRREFWSLDLAVTPAVLIPRPETELLVERALARLPNDARLRIADVGTGSGALALALARERPRARVVAVDACAQALVQARENAARHGIQNIEFRHGDWTGPLAGESFDMIVSNPPYIQTHDPHLRAGDLRFEPRAALDGGADGLEAIRAIVENAPHHLIEGGWLLLEHGFDQKDAVLALLARRGLKETRDYADYAGHDRVAEARRP